MILARDLYVILEMRAATAPPPINVNTTMQSIRSLRSSTLTPAILRIAYPRWASLRIRSFATSHAGAPDIYDVVIVGGGPAGLSLASSLRMRHYPPA